MNLDPYATLGLDPGASDAELRAVYRHLVQLHHPDHNGGSPESARRFEEIQDAYARIRQLRADRPAPSNTRADRSTTTGDRSRTTGHRSSTGADPDLETRLAAIERELANRRAAQAQAQRDREAARARARQAGREANAAGESKRPSDEELGYFKTDDSLSKILADAISELTGAAGDVKQQVSREARERHVGKRVSELIDELGARLGGERSKTDDD